MGNDLTAPAVEAHASLAAGDTLVFDDSNILAGVKKSKSTDDTVTAFRGR
jgi:hypothetical protein